MSVGWLKYLIWIRLKFDLLILSVSDIDFSTITKADLLLEAIFLTIICLKSLDWSHIYKYVFSINLPSNQCDLYN